MNRTRRRVEPQCRPILYATFRDEHLVRVEYHHRWPHCTGPCDGTTTTVDPDDYYPPTRPRRAAVDLVRSPDDAVDLIRARRR
jgi:hypothetical protein